MEKKIFYFVLSIFFSLKAFSQVKVGRTIMDYEIESFGETLKMNGAGDRSLLFIELYSIALYLQNKNQDALGLCFADETMSMSVVITSKIIDRELFLESIQEDFERVTDNNPGPLQGRIDKATNFFKEPIVKDDIIEFAYEKGVGTHFVKNGKELGLIEGQDFKFALYKIWLGDKPINNKLKNELLGIN